MDEEVKEMEQEIDKLIKINTKLQQQTESMQSQSQKQSDLVKQVEAKHTEAIHKTEEEMKRLKFQFDAVTVNHRRLKARDRQTHQNKHKVTATNRINAITITKQSDLVKEVEAKHTEAIHKTEEEMKRLKFQFDAVTVN
eukprot:192104_1